MALHRSVISLVVFQAGLFLGTDAAPTTRDRMPSMSTTGSLQSTDSALLSTLAPGSSPRTSFSSLGTDFVSSPIYPLKDHDGRYLEIPGGNHPLNHNKATFPQTTDGSQTNGEKPGSDILDDRDLDVYKGAQPKQPSDEQPEDRARPDSQILNGFLLDPLAPPTSNVLHRTDPEQGIGSILETVSELEAFPELKTDPGPDTGSELNIFPKPKTVTLAGVLYNYLKKLSRPEKPTALSADTVILPGDDNTVVCVTTGNQREIPKAAKAYMRGRETAPFTHIIEDDKASLLERAFSIDGVGDRYRYEPYGDPKEKDGQISQREPPSLYAQKLVLDLMGLATRENLADPVGWLKDFQDGKRIAVEASDAVNLVLKWFPVMKEWQKMRPQNSKELHFVIGLDNLVDDSAVEPAINQHFKQAVVITGYKPGTIDSSERESLISSGKIMAIREPGKNVRKPGSQGPTKPVIKRPQDGRRVMFADDAPKNHVSVFDYDDEGRFNQILAGLKKLGTKIKRVRDGVAGLGSLRTSRKGPKGFSYESLSQVNK